MVVFCERIWSAHDFILNKRRSSMKPDTLDLWVYIYTNLRLLDNRNGKTAQHKSKLQAADAYTWIEQDALSSESD